MSIFKRLFKIGQAETNSAIDKLEDPIKMTEQGIRDMKVDLDKSIHGLAELKALAIRARNDAEDSRRKATEYEEKAILLLQKAQAGQLDQAEADRLATEALVRRDNCQKNATQAELDKSKFDGNVAQMEQNIRSLKDNINKWDNELRTLKARVRVSAATQALNKQLAQLDASGTVSMLERMKDKVSQQEALAESYGQIASDSKSVDDEIDKALDSAARLEATRSLAELKAKMGVTEEGTK